MNLNNRKKTAQRLSMSVRRLIELEKAGKICAVQDGRVVKYTDDEIQRYIDDLPLLRTPVGIRVMTVLFVLLLVAAIGWGAWLFTVGFRREQERLDELLARFDRDMAAKDLRSDEWWRADE